MTIGTALPPSEILSGIEDKRVVVTLDADIESNDWGFLLALNRKEGGPVIEVIHCGSDKAWAAGYRLALMTWAVSLDFEVRERRAARTWPGSEMSCGARVGYEPGGPCA